MGRSRLLVVVALALATYGLGCEDLPEEPENADHVVASDNEVVSTEAVEAAVDLPIDLGDGGSVAEALRDVSLAANVKLKLAEETGIDISKIDLQVRDGRVTLLGEVASQEVRSRAADAAQSIKGVREVINQLSAPDIPAQSQLTSTASTEVEPNELQAQAQPEQAEASAAVYYTIKRGDNLGAIARRHGTTVAQLQKLNNIRGTNIRAGQRLRVK